MVDLINCLTNSLFLDNPLLYYYYASLNSSIICSFFPGDMYLSFGASDPSLFSGFLDSLETLVTLSTILLPIKSPVASAVLLECFF